MSTEDLMLTMADALTDASPHLDGRHPEAWSKCQAALDAWHRRDRGWVAPDVTGRLVEALREAWMLGEVVAYPTEGRLRRWAALLAEAAARPAAPLSAEQAFRDVLTVLADSCPPGEPDRSDPETMRRMAAAVLERFPVAHPEVAPVSTCTIEDCEEPAVACQRHLDTAYDSGAGDMASAQREIEELRARASALPEGYKIGPTVRLCASGGAAEMAPGLLPAVRAAHAAILAGRDGARTATLSLDGHKLGCAAVILVSNGSVTIEENRCNCGAETHVAAYLAGRDAALDERPIDDCPHVAGARRMLWRFGWLAGEMLAEKNQAQREVALSPAPKPAPHIFDGSGRYLCGAGQMNEAMAPQRKCPECWRLFQQRRERKAAREPAPLGYEAFALFIARSAGAPKACKALGDRLFWDAGEAQAAAQAHATDMGVAVEVRRVGVAVEDVAPGAAAPPAGETAPVTATAPIRAPRKE